MESSADLWAELSRLALKYAAACANPLSCPRDRSILLTRIADLKEMAAPARRLPLSPELVSEDDKAKAVKYGAYLKSWDSQKRDQAT